MRHITCMSMDSLALPPRTRLADEVHQALLHAIFEGRFAAGSRLSVPAISAQLGVSRTPVREAIQRLTRDGLATEVANKGAVLLEVGPAHLASVYEVREVLEGLSARAATERMSDEQVRELGQVVEAHRAAVAAGDEAGHVEWDMKFHEMTRAGAANEELAILLERLQSKIRLAMVATTVTAGPERALKDHEAIYEAIAARDPDRAERVARSHVARLRRHLAPDRTG